MYKLAIAVVLCFNLFTTNAATNKNLFKRVNYTQLANHQDFSDLAEYGQAIGDKRIVFLNELSHGEEEVFALKSRLVRYLHQEKGFDVLLLESSLFDVNQIWQNRKQALAAQAPGKIFYMYANNTSVQALLSYIDVKRDSKKPLSLSGFDGRLLGTHSANSVVDFIRQGSQTFLASVLPNFDWPLYSKQAQAIFSAPKAIPDEKRKRFSLNKVIDCMINYWQLNLN